LLFSHTASHTRLVAGLFCQHQQPRSSHSHACRTIFDPLENSGGPFCEERNRPKGGRRGPQAQREVIPCVGPKTPGYVGGNIQSARPPPERCGRLSVEDAQRPRRRDERGCRGELAGTLAAQRPRASPPPSLPPIEPGANVQRWWRLKQTEGLLDKAYAREDALSADLSRVTAEAEALRERVRVLESEAAMASEQKQRLVEAVHENKQAAEQQAVQAVDMQARCNAVAAQAAEEAAKAKAEADAAKKLASNLQRVVDALCPIDSPEPPLVQPCARPPLTPLPQVQTKPAPGHEALKVQWPERRLDVNRPDNDKVKALGARPRTHAGRFLYWVKPAGVDPAKFQQWLA
jgi:hypothetical protein